MFDSSLKFYLKVFMPKKRPNYVDRFKAIKPFVTFQYTEKFLKSKRLSLKQKRKITSYFKEISALQSRPHQIYKSKSKKKLEAVQIKAQHTKKLPDLKVAFVPAVGKVKVKFKNNEPYFTETIGKNNIEIKSLQFDLKKLAKDPVNHSTAIIKNETAKTYQIQAGKYEIPNSYAKEFVPGEVAKLVNRYGNEKNKNGKKNNHYFKNWLIGINAVYAKRQASAKNYIKVKNAKKKEFKKRAKNRNR